MASHPFYLHRTPPTPPSLDQPLRACPTRLSAPEDNEELPYQAHNNNTISNYNIYIIIILTIH